VVADALGHFRRYEAELIEENLSVRSPDRQFIDEDCSTYTDESQVDYGTAAGFKVAIRKR
jgi:hypothetical protein